MSTVYVSRRALGLPPAHEARQPWWRRRKLLAASLALLVLAVPGVAVAAILYFTAGIGGSVTVPQSPNLNWKSTPAPVVLSQSGPIQCGATSAGDRLTLTVTGWPGSSCVIRGNLVKTNTEPLKLQDVLFGNGSGRVAVQFVTGQGCGIDVSADVGGSGTPVQLRVSIPEGATPGSATAGADAGVRAVLASEYVAGDCPQG